MDRKTHILDTAQILFAQFGLKKTTVDEIAREARVSKATFYRFFKDKAEVFDLVVQKESGELLESMSLAIGCHETAEGQLRAHLHIRVGRVTDFVNFYRVTQDSWVDYWPHVARIRKEFLAKEHAMISKVLSDGVEAGELEIRDPDRAALVLILALASVEFQWSLAEGDFTLPEVVDLMLSMVLDGIRKG